MNEVKIRFSIVALATWAALGFTGTALAQGACEIETLLDFPFDSAERILPSAVSLDGRTALVLRQDPEDGSPDVFELDLRSGALTRVTDVPNEVFFDPVGTPDKILGGILPSKDLSRFLFTSRADFVGENPNNASNWFLFDRATGEITQVSQSDADRVRLEAGDRRLSRLRLSPDAKTIAATEVQALEDDLGTLAVHNVILLDVETGTREQITFVDERLPEDDPFFPFGERFNFGVFSEDSQWLSLHTWGDFRDLRGFNVTLHHIPTGEQVQLLDGASGVDVIYLSAGAQVVIFKSRQDFTGGNPDGSPELFRLDRSSGELRQLTDLVPNALREFRLGGVVSSDGSAIAYSLLTTDFTENGLQIQRSVGELRWLEIASGSDVLIAESAMELTVDENGNQDFIGDTNLGESPLFKADGRRFFYLTNVDLTAGTDMPPRGSKAFTFQIDCSANAPRRFFPQIGDGVSGNIRFQSNIVLTNAGPATGIDLRFFDAQGEPMEIELEGLGRSSRFQIPIGRGRTVSLTSAGTDPLAVGYASLSAPESVDATAVFTRSETDSGVVQYEAGVPLSRALESFSLAVDTIGAKDTGLAMAAPRGGEPASIRLRLYDEEFELLGEREITLEPGRHLARFVGELFPSVARAAEMRGTLTASSDLPMPAVALRQGDDPGVQFPLEVPTLTAFPVVERMVEPSAPLLDVSPR